MEIEVRALNYTTNRYASVMVHHSGATINIGVLDARDRQELAKKLQEAIDELLHDLPSKEESAA